jgi:dihydropteroate synthase
MGVLNITPDSFSDGGEFLDPQAAIEHAQAMAAEGAAIIDIGGESTRPGSDPVPPAEQIRRVVPVIEAIRPALEALISIDTTSSVVARAALDAGADLINDISAGTFDADLLPLAAGRGAPVVLMHMKGTPRTMQQDPRYDDVVSEVRDYLRARLEAACAAGVARSKILLDPGIGFGKTVQHNLSLLRHLPELAGPGQPLLIGTSRKGFIGTLTGERLARDRLFGTAATVAWSVANGASVVRVHDVRQMKQVVDVIEAISLRRRGNDAGKPG